MKLKKIYEFVVEKGIENDPRGKAKVEQGLKRLRKSYEELSTKEKDEFDIERLKNPYSDTKILFGTGEEEIKRIMIGIDIEVGEVLLAEMLRQKGKKIDLLLSHHPEGRALAGFYHVMHMQTDILSQRGVPVNIAENLMRERISEVERKIMPANHAKAVDAARLLNIPFLCVHTPADNHVAKFLQNLMDKKKPQDLVDIVDILGEIPEYKQAVKNNAGPKIIYGTKSSRAGKIFVDMTGGTEGSKEIFKNLAQAGVGTIVGMHLSEEHLKKAKAEYINVVIAGHISSDTLGLNLLLDSLEKKQRMELISCSGFTRIKRDG